MLEGNERAEGQGDKGGIDNKGLDFFTPFIWSHHLPKKEERRETVNPRAKNHPHVVA